MGSRTAPLEKRSKCGIFRAYTAEQLSAYKLPHSVHVVGEIPRTGSGKIIRFKLREMLLGEGDPPR
jgi:acyl-CoA synthetase (AMP-forming)/AMP-acid ligase II